MKRLLYLITVFALLCGCEKNQEQLEQDQEQDAPVTELGELPDRIQVSTAGDEDDAETRTILENSKVLWQNGDAISYFASNIHNTRYVYGGEDGKTSVDLDKDEEAVGAVGDILLNSQAVYPYNKDITVDYKDGRNIINLTYPTTQKYGVNSFGRDANIMVAAGEGNVDAKLQFRNACGYLVIKLWGVATNGNPTNIKSITLSSVSGLDKIAGKASVIADKKEAPIITMADDASTSVTLDCDPEGRGVNLGVDKENATEFWFCLPPVTFNGGIKITVTDAYGNAYTKQTTKPISIERNKVQPMEALQFETNAPSATKLWYTRSDGSKTPLTFYDGKTNPFNAQIKTHKWDDSVNKIVIEFDAPLTTIQKEAFRKTKIGTIVLPEGVTTIEEGAFRASTLTEISFPGSMTNIGVNAFYDCEDIKTVTFLPSPTKTPLKICNMDSSAVYSPFYDSRLTTINLNRELAYVDEDGDPYTASEDDEGLFYHEHYEEVEEVTVVLGSQVEHLRYRMFNYLPIKELTIPGTVKSIENNVFEGCEKLTTLTFESNMEGAPLTMGFYDASDDDGPFYSCPLTTVNLNREISYNFGGSTINDVYEGLFGGKPTLVSVTLGEQVKTLSPYMFAGSYIKELVIPGNVTTIGNNVFEGCEKLTTLTFESNMEGAPLTMGFYDASGDTGPFYDSPLTTLNLNREISYNFGGSTIDDVYEGLFGGKSTLVNVTLGEQVKTLSLYMFAGSSIKELVIPGSVKTIANDVFRGCSSLKTITFEPSPTAERLTIGFDTNNVDESLFVDCPLVSVSIDRELYYTLEGIDVNYKGLFGYKTSLTSVTIGDQLKTLSPYMFAGNGVKSLNLNKVETIANNALADLAITSLTIPGTVTTIGDSVFSGCSKLATITFEPNSSGKELAIGPRGGYSPFFDSPLTTLDLNRELKYPIPGQPASGLFGAKKDLTRVTLGDQVKTLSPFMFANSGLTSLDLNKVETIQTRALAGLALTSLTIPGCVKSIDNCVFVNCTALKELTFNPNDKGEALKIGFYEGAIDDAGPFYDCNELTTVKLNRELDYTFPISDINDPSEGVFGNRTKLINLTIGEQVKTISPYMFAGIGIKKGVGKSESNTISESQYVLNLNKVEGVGNSAFRDTDITNLLVTPSVAIIDDHAFADCESLVEVIVQSSEEPLTIGFQPGSDQHGPFWQSPLNNVVLIREIVPTEAYADACDQYDEGIFANEHSLETIEGSPEPMVQIISNVKTLHPYMFSGWGMTDMTIPSCVSEIKDNAFYNCYKLANLTFGSSNEDLVIGFQPGNDQHGPFYQSPLTKITLNRSLVLSEAYASACDSSDEGLFSTKHGSQNTTISLGGQVAKIPEFMFGCLPLTEIFIPATVTEIGNDAFADCTKLSSIVFEEGSAPLVIGYNTVGDDDGPFVDSPLTSVVLNREISYNFGGSTIDDVYEGLFGGRTTLTSVTLGNTIKTISPYMFANSNITELDLNNVETIGEGALMGADFTDLTIPASVTTIGNYAFANCESLKNLTFEENTKELTIGFQPGTNEHGPFYQSPLEKVVVNRGIVLSEDYFRACDSSNEGIFATQHGSQRTSVSLGGLVSSIPRYMFSELPIEKLTIPATVNSIGVNAFKNCEALIELTLEDGPNTLTVSVQETEDVLKGPFYQSPLRKIHIGRDIKYVKKDGSSFAPYVSEFGFFTNNKDVESCEVTFGPVYGPQTLSPYMFSGVKMESITIPAYVKEIGNNAFELCSKLNTVTFEESATPLTMGYYDGFGPFGDDDGPFYSCPLTTVNLYREINYTFGGADIDEADEGLFGDKTSLTNVTLGDYVKTLSPYMFANSNITELDLRNVETIGDGALMGVDFTDLTIPASVKTIGNFAFANCESLANLTFADGADDLTIGFQPGSDERGPFYQSPLSYINLNRQLVMDEEYTTNCDQWDEGVFSNKYYEDGDWTAKVILGDKVETILPYMFATVRMEQLHLPETVDYIGEYVVDECPILNAIVFYDDKVRPVVADNAFGDADVLDDYNYFLFIPRWTLNVGVNETSVYYTHNDDQNTYWKDLCMVMTDVGHDYIHSPLILNNREYWKRYYDAENNCTKSGYEWYTARYLNNEIITPPTE